MSRKLQIPSVQREKESLHPLGLAAICFGFSMIILDTSVINVALPTMQRDLHGSLEGLQWVVYQGKWVILPIRLLPSAR